MFNYIIKPSGLKGDITIPSSKSHTLRAILFGSLAHGKTLIENPLDSPDTLSMIRAMRSFGAKISHDNHRIEIEGLNGKLGCADDVIDAGNSGIVFRFVSAIAALSHHPVVITGDHSLRHQRPITPLLEGLMQLGVKAISTKNDGFAPVIIQGPMCTGKIKISGEDSQPVSGLLIAAAMASGPIELSVANPGEKPWIQMTLDWLDRLGLKYKHQEYEKYSIDGNQTYPGFHYSVPGDFSTAAFPIVAALITQSEITLNNMDFSDVQGDKKVIDVLKKMGANIHVDEKLKKIHIRKSPVLEGIKIDLNAFIDAITPLAVLACFAEGETHLTNAAVARTKECDRIHAISTELMKMGADIEEEKEGLIIRHSKLKGAHNLASYNDHRMVMALAVAAMGAEGASCIHGIDCVSKTYPAFMHDFQSLGAQIERQT